MSDKQAARELIKECNRLDIKISGMLAILDFRDEIECEYGEEYFQLLGEQTKEMNDLLTVFTKKLLHMFLFTKEREAKIMIGNFFRNREFWVNHDINWEGNIS